MAVEAAGEGEHDHAGDAVFAWGSEASEELWRSSYYYRLQRGANLETDIPGLIQICSLVARERVSRRRGRRIYQQPGTDCSGQSAML